MGSAESGKEKCWRSTPALCVLDGESGDGVEKRIFEMLSKGSWNEELEANFKSFAGRLNEILKIVGMEDTFHFGGARDEISKAPAPSSLLGLVDGCDIPANPFGPSGIFGKPFP